MLPSCDVSVDLKQLKAILLECGGLVAGYFGPGCGVAYKRDGSPVTEADTRANEFLHTALHDLLPQAAWLSEETVAHPSRHMNDWLWVVDPLDGTKEFLKGIPEFAVSVGLAYRQNVVLGGVVNPIRKEGAAALCGGPFECWGIPTPPASARDLATARVSLSRTEVEDGSVPTRLPGVGSTLVVGSVAYKLMRVATRQDDMTFSVYPKHEWDVCGGIALVLASRQSYQRLDKKPVLFNQDDPCMRGGAAAGPEPLVSSFLQRWRETGLEGI